MAPISSWLTAAVLLSSTAHAPVGAWQVPFNVRGAGTPVVTRDWQVQLKAGGAGILVVTGVNSDGRLSGTAFGKPLHGTWNGVTLTFHVSHGDDLYSIFSARLAREGPGAAARHTLTGTETVILSACYLHERFPALRWNAYLVPPGVQK